MDRSIESGFVPGVEVIRATLDQPQPIVAIKVFGASPYRLQISGRDGNALGFGTIDLSKLKPGWQLVTSSTSSATDVVELRFTPLAKAAKVPEIELWTLAKDAVSARHHDVSSDELAEGLVELRPSVRSDDLTPGDCATFDVPLTRAPTVFERAHLVFEAEGLFRSFSLQRSINGLAEYGGAWLAGDPSRRVFADEIDPAALQLGTNHLRLCLPSDATRGVSLSKVRIVGDLDLGVGYVATATVGKDEKSASGLLDRDPQTSVDLSAGEQLLLSMPRLTSPEAIEIAARSAIDPATVECVAPSGSLEPIRVTKIVDDRFYLEGGSASCRALALTFRNQVSLTEVDVIGSGAAEAVDWPRVVITSPPEHFGEAAYVGGFVSRPSAMPGAIRVEVATQKMSAMTGDFGSTLARNAAIADPWPVNVTAKFPDGTTHTQQIILDQDLRAQIKVADSASGTKHGPAATTPFGQEGDSVVVRARMLEATTVRLGTKVGVDVPIGAVEKATNITVRHLGEDVLPPLDPGMINVSAPKNRGYEFLPHGQKFKKAVEVTLPYDPTLIPEGMTPEDINTYFFDPKSERWIKLQRTAIDVGQRTTRSRTDHFTIMINAILAVPTNPAPLSFDPTALTSIGAASPAANIDLIEPPVANSSGDARLSLPLRLPQARGNYSPSLALTYGSSGGNGALGLGWDLSSSKIEIDSRWGVPNYATSDEHRYLLDGAALVPTLETEGPTCAGEKPGRRYHTRVEGGFAHILRCGDAATNYHWELRDRDGTLFVYGSVEGTDPDDWETDPSRASLGSVREPKGIYRWSLRRVVDVYGNTTEMSYQVDVAPGFEPSRDTYLGTIAYTSHTSGKNPSYSVHVILDDGSRPDRIVSGRGGFKQVTKRLVRAIEVKFGSQTIREYVLTYAHGQFDKSVLSRVAVFGVGGCNASTNAFEAPACAAAAFFHEHAFDYYREDEGFDPVEHFTATGPNSTVQTFTQSKSTTLSGNLSLGVSSDTKIGATLARSERNEEIGLYDIDGNGVVDQLFSDGTVLYNQSRPDRAPGSGPLFAPTGPVLTHGFPAMPRDIQWSAGVSASAGFDVDAGFGGTISAGFESAWSRATRLLTDVNGDNFIDVVYTEDDGRHDAGTADLGSRCGTNESEVCFSTTPIFQFDPYDDPVLEQVAQDVAARTFVVDPIVQWTAPFDGDIMISGSATKAGAGGTDGVTLELYEGDLRLEALALAATQTETVFFPPSPIVRTVSKGDVLYLRVKTGSDEAIGPDNTLLDLVDARLLVRYSQLCTSGLCLPIPAGFAGKDPTGAPVTVFDSKQDLRVSGAPRGFMAPERGVLQLQAQLTKRVSAAPLRVCVQRLPALNEFAFDRDLDKPCSASAFNISGTISLAAGSASPVPLDLAFPVEAGQFVVVRVESDLSFDPYDVALVANAADTPLLAYLSVCPINDDGTPGACTSDPAAIDDVPVATASFGASVFLVDQRPAVPFVAPKSAFITVSYPLVSGDYVYAIRSAQNGIIKLDDCRGGTTCNTSDDVFFTSADDSITFEVVTDSVVLQDCLTASYPGSQPSCQVPLTVRRLTPPELDATPFAGGYRGWRAAMWNENVPFEPGPLLADYADLANQTVDRQREIARTVFTPFAIADSVFAHGPAWQAPLSAAFVAASGLHAARLGLGSTEASDADRGGLFAGKFARQSITRSLYLGIEAKLEEIEFANLTLQATKSTTDSTVDLVDLDGDGVLDMIGGKQTFLSLLAAASPLNELLGFSGGFRKRKGHEYSIGFGAHAIRRATTPGGRTIWADSNTSPEGLFGGTGYAIARTQAEEDLVDVSGDGLPDRVTRSGAVVFVRYNLGHRFSEEELFGTVDSEMRRPIDRFETTLEALGAGPFTLNSTRNALQHDTTITKHKRGGINVDVGVGSLDVGKSRVTVSTRTTRQLADLNGDGLPDLLVKRDGELDEHGNGIIYVQFNRGGDFGPMRPWFAQRWLPGMLPSPGLVDLGSKLLGLGLTGPDVLAFTGATSTGYSGSITVAGNGGGGGRTKSTDRYEMGLVDINGDGAADHVLRRDGAGSLDEIFVKTNRISGKVNLLREVRRPLGAIITLEYTRVGNTVEMPQSKQVLSKVTVDDGVDLGAAFASPNLVTTITYSGGFHHRNEKEFYGFRMVTATRSDGVSVEEEYENSRGLYPLRGRLLRQTKRDGNGNLFAEKRLTYQVRAVTDRTGFPVVIDPACSEKLHPLLAAQPDACVPRFPVVVREENTRAEGGTLAKTQRMRDEEFDRFGNVLVSIDEADDAIASDDVYARARYENDTTRWILGRTISLEVRAGSETGTLLRERTGVYNNSGDPVTLSVKTGSGTADTTLQYDAFGNVIHVTTPPNASGQTQTYAVEFDTQTATYPVLVRDGFGYTSEAKYDLLFGVATKETDLNNQSIVRTLDRFGRLETVQGPYDTATSPALSMSYILAGPYPRATTVTRASAASDYTGEVPSAITTVTIVDGLGRSIELRKTAVVAGTAGMTSSGLVQRDAEGNVLLTYHPFFTAGASTDFVLPGETPLATRTEYDAMDRPTKTIFPDDNIETTSYDVTADPDGRLLFVMRSIAANGNPRETFTDLAGRTRAFVEHPAHSTSGPDAVTRYEYLPTGELAKIVDAEGNVTSLAYDLRGLRTRLDNPDTGLIEDRFDLMGNRVATIEPNHRALGVEVTYVFERNRLKKIDYPSKSDATFEYGLPGASDGRAGRIARITDESGSQQHFYGALGEMRKTVRTVTPDKQGSQDVVFETKFISDSLGRQLQLRYPDGVVVSNKYDAGGMLARVEGTGSGWTRVYAKDLQYDVFGNRTQMRLGNDALTTWAFDEKRVRLEKLTTTIGSSKKLQNLSYKYDAASNPIEIKNQLDDLTGGSGNMPGESTLTLKYDGVDRLTRSEGDAQLSAQKRTTYVQTFEYSASHNITQKARTHLIAQPNVLIATAPSETNFSSTYTYGAVRPHLPTQIGDMLLTYDPSGNPTLRRKQSTGSQQVLVWDDDNRLVDFTSSGVHQHNTYDASGLRVRRKSTQSETLFANQFFDLENGTQGVRHVFAGGTRVASELGKFEGGENPAAPNKLGTVYFFHQDHLGSTALLTTVDGSVHESLEFFSDGETWIDRGPLKPVNRYLFSGKPFDPDTGFYDFGERFYDPRTSLWLGIDQLFVDDSSAALRRTSILSPTAFAGHNPVRLIDPDGRGLFDGVVVDHETKSVRWEPWSLETRVAGVAQAAAGATLIGIAGGLCAGTGVGCAVAPALATMGMDLLYHGSKQAVTNKHEATLVGQAFGPTAQDIQVAGAGAVGIGQVVMNAAKRRALMSASDEGGGGGGGGSGGGGNAVVRHYATEEGNHFTVQVGELQTHQVILDESRLLTQVEAAAIRRQPTATAQIPLADPASAQAAQRAAINRGVTGPWKATGPGANSCATHVCEVLRAGGAAGAPSNPAEARAFVYTVFGLPIPP